MEIVRNLGRHRLRSFLTISGIVIGVFALTTMGAMAENFNALIGGGVTFFGSNIQISSDSTAAGSFLPLSKVDEVRQVPGVAAAFGDISVPAKPGELVTVSFGVPDTIYAEDPGSAPYSSFHLSYAAGHDYTATGRGDVVLGSSFATEMHKKVGDTLDLPIRPAHPSPNFVNHPFTVVGLLATTQTAPDTGAFINLRDGQMLLADSLPEALKSQVDATALIESVTAYARPGTSLTDLDALARKINQEVPGVKALEPSTVVNSFKSGGAIFTAITTGAALLAVVIGGLSVVNTMLMAVTERIREIGLKKAVGAHTRHILLEYLAEAVLIGFSGGLVGYLLGLGLTSAINAATKSTGNQLFLVTTGLTIESLGFAVGLGAVAGLIPAYRAARMDPVVALRSVT